MSDPLKRERVQIERKLDVAIPVSHYLPSRPEKSSCNIEQIYTASNYHFLGPIFFRPISFVKYVDGYQGIYGNVVVVTQHFGMQLIGALGPALGTHHFRMLLTTILTPLLTTLCIC